MLHVCLTTCVQAAGALEGFEEVNLLWSSISLSTSCLIHHVWLWLEGSEEFGLGMPAAGSGSPECFDCDGVATGKVPSRKWTVFSERGFAPLQLRKLQQKKYHSNF